MSEKREIVFGMPVTVSDALDDPRKVLVISGPTTRHRCRMERIPGCYDGFLLILEDDGDDG